jgi:uncharacterized protein (DUF1800 family)
MAVQPAMLRYLDNETNLASAPNLNFGRELLELFLLGAGNYDEGDVVTAARAWTGHGLDALGTYRYAADDHDHGVKTFFGEDRAWDGPELIDALLDRPTTRAQVCRLVADKLARFLVAPTVSDQLVADAANAFGASGLRIGALVRAILNHPEFWAPAARHALVRPPVDYVVSVLRALRLGPDVMPPDWYLPQLGQILFRPPDVSGWSGIDRWQAPGVARAKLDFSAHAAWMATGGGADHGILADVGMLGPTDVLQRLARAFGIDELSTTSRDTVLGWLAEQRSAPGDSWAERGNLLVLASLLPEVQYA